MRKSLLIPLQSLGPAPQAALLEFYVETTRRPAPDVFAPLRGLELDAGVNGAQRLLRGLPAPSKAVRLFATHAGFALRQAAPLALGLALSRYLLEAGCRWQRLVVAGIVRQGQEDTANPAVFAPFSDGQALAALRQLEGEAPTLVLVPETRPALYDPYLRPLAANPHVTIRPVRDLLGAYRACLAGWD